MFGSILKHPDSICKPCTGQSIGQQVPHGNFFPSAGWFHAGFVACTLDVKLPLPLSSPANEQSYRFFFHKTCHLLPFQASSFLNEIGQEWRLQKPLRKTGKKISLQGKERIISLICICNSSGSILIKDFEHHHSMPILASSFSERWSLRRFLAASLDSKHNWNQLICFNWSGNTTEMCLSDINIMKIKYFK